MKPFYKHDCSRCHHLGSIVYPAPYSLNGRKWTEMRRADLYICNIGQTLGPDLIARFSSRGSDYASSMAKLMKEHYLKQDEFCTHGPALIAAYYFAKAKGLIK